MDVERAQNVLRSLKDGTWRLPEDRPLSRALLDLVQPGIRRRFCPHGHALEERNIYRQRDALVCLACKRPREAERKRRKRLEGV